MNKNSGILTLLAENNYASEMYGDLIDVLVNYYEVNDIRQSTNKTKIFKALFISLDKQANEIIAAENFVSPRTLDRYIQDFNDLALKICKIRKTRYGDLLKIVVMLKKK